MIRDVQYELPSAWMFYMGLSREKQALVVMNQFSSFPLSLARLCAHVIITGIGERDRQMMQDIADAKGIENFSCVDTIESLATKFDIIVVFDSGKPGSLWSSFNSVRKFIHPDTEIWTLASNTISPGNIRGTLKSMIERSEKNNEPQKKYTPFGETPVNQGPNIRETKEQFRKLGCKPFAFVGLSPSFIKIEAAKPINGSVHQLPVENSFSLWEQISAETVAIGAAERPLTQSYLNKLLDSLPNSSFSSGTLLDYSVSPSGKVMLFTEYESGSRKQKIVIKLPLNEHAIKRAKVNQMILSYLKNSGNDVLDSRVPEPISEGLCENQGFFAESILDGNAGDKIKEFRRNPDNILMQIFPFWLAAQRAFAKKVTIDEVYFKRLVEKPLADAFGFAPEDHRNEGLENRILDYLRRQLLGSEWTLSLIHGDFSVKNILFNRHNGRVSGIIDWDMARLEAFPILDVFHFFLRTRYTSYRISKFKILQNLIKTDKLFLKISDMYSDAFQIDKGMFDAFTILYWAYRLGGHTGTIKFIDEQFLTRNYNEPLQIIEKNIIV